MKPVPMDIPHNPLSGSGKKVPDSVEFSRPGTASVEVIASVVVVVAVVVVCPPADIDAIVVVVVDVVATSDPVKNFRPSSTSGFRFPVSVRQFSSQ